MTKYEYAGDQPNIGQQWAKVAYLKKMPGTQNLDQSCMPADVAVELINRAEKVEASKKQQDYNGYGLIVDDGKMLFSLTDFESVKEK